MNPNQNLAPNQDLDPNQDLTPNQINNISTRLCKAKEFIQENPNEQTITVARIYNLSGSTLRSAISRRPTSKANCGGHNKILQEYQIKALHLFIRSLLASQIQPTYHLIYNAIC